MNQLEQRYLKAKRALFDKVLGARLNSEQRRAVFTAKGPVLVLAGAGSGKTTVLVNRIAHIIKYGDAYFSDKIYDDVNEGTVAALEGAIDMDTEELSYLLPEFAEEPCAPWQMLAITFTNKAANEIKERLLKTFEDESVASSIWAGTFHSICLRILRKYADRLGYREGFSIYDADDTKRLISVCMKELNIDEKRLSPKAAANVISAAKDKLEGPGELEITRDVRSRDVSRIYELYQKKLMEYNAVDFDDIIMKTVELLNNEADVREYYQNKFKYVLVDEYQDTNYAQFILTKLLSDKYRNIMVVGDDDQSIYKFRGATIENILNFDKTYPDATVVKLEQNYRSTETILDAANAIIKNNDERHQKALWSAKGRGEKIIVHEVEEASNEGRYIIDRITAGVKNEGRKYSDYAVLYRVNELARSLETTFTKSAIPYKILGSMRFYDRKEIRDMLAYLFVINASEDALRLKRIINEPKRKIGDATVKAAEEIAAMTGLSLYQVCQRAAEFDALSKSADRLIAFTELIESIKSRFTKPSDIMEAVFVETGYRAMLEAEGFEGEGRIAAINEFKSAAQEYEARCDEEGSEPNLVDFLEDISLVSDVDKYDEEADAVVLMTIHAAKGLEFPVVFIAGTEDGIFPSQQNMGESEEMSEERRLMYVAITRAKEMLYITHSKSRTMYGRTGYNMLSVFIREELPKNLATFERARSEYNRGSSYGTSGNRAFYGNSGARDSQSYSYNRRSSEVNRAIDFGVKPTAPKTRSAENFGIEKIPQGARVKHVLFGEGTVVSSKDMGGDVLYEVNFDNGQTKRLMQTFAKLERI